MWFMFVTLRPYHASCRNSREYCYAKALSRMTELLACHRTVRVSPWRGCRLPTHTLSIAAYSGE